MRFRNYSVVSVALLVGAAGAVLAARTADDSRVPPTADAALATLIDGFSEKLESVKRDIDVLNKLARNPVPVGTIAGYFGNAKELATWEERGWIRCDGRTLTDKVLGPRFTPLANALAGVARVDPKQGTLVIPELRDEFLRGSGFGENGRPPGDRQDWSTALPRNAFVTDTEDAHPLNSQPEFNSLVRVGNTCTKASSDDKGPEIDLCQAHPINAVPAHSHRINKGGDKETRPANTAVTWMIFIGTPDAVLTSDSLPSSRP